MAKSSATWEGRRALTDNSNLGPETANAAAEELMRLDYLAEAAIFYDRAENDQGLMEVIKKAVEEGNFFVFQNAAARLRGARPDRAWAADLLARAEKTGKTLYAALAKEYLENN